MNKVIKRILAIVLIAALVCGGIVGGLLLYRNVSAKPVDVYMARDFAVTEYWGDNAETYGMVRTDRIQTVYPGDAETVTQIYVKPGDQVKTGDALVQLDTTLSAINLEKAEISVQRLKLEKEQAEKDLKTISAMKPHATVLVKPDQKDIVYKSHATPSIISGSGTSNDPYYCLWGTSDVLDHALLEEYWSLGNKTPAPPEEEEGDEEGEEGEEEEPATEEEPSTPAHSVYVAFVTRKMNALNAEITGEWGLEIMKQGGELVMKYYKPVLSAKIRDYESNPDPYYIQTGSAYTAAEIAKMKAEKEKEIVDLTLQNKIAEVDLEKLKKEVSDGVVKSTLDGVVKTVRDPDEAYATGLPVVEVSGGGGYYIEVSMSEMDLGTLLVGDEVQVNDWMSGMQYTGKVTEISEYPTNDSNAWTDGNNNVSFYPFTVFVDESASLEEFNYVSVVYNRRQGDTSGFYLENMFIRTEDGVSFVYVKGENGKLEKRTIQTGRSLWGSHTQIRGGITPDDRVAFPYGKDVKDGTRTNDATAEDFYNKTY